MLLICSKKLRKFCRRPQVNLRMATVVIRDFQIQVLLSRLRPQVQGVNEMAVKLVMEKRVHALHQTLIRARNMVSESSSTGVFRRMNRRERLRSAAPYGPNQQGKGDAKINTVKKRQSKPIEFALLKCYDDADDEDDEHHLKWNSIIANGMIMAEEDDRRKHPKEIKGIAGQKV